MSDAITGRRVTNPKGNRANLTGMGKGRPKGVPNIINRDIKEMILGALSDVGGRAYLAEQAKRNPNAFLGLVGKILPYQIAGHDGGAFVIRLAPLDSSDSIASSSAPNAPTIEGAIVDAEVVADDTDAHRDHGDGARSDIAMDFAAAKFVY
jgi:hypothetical protein